MGRSEFENCHPIVNFFYFASVILWSMFLMHPVFVCVSLVCSFFYSILLNGKKAVKFNFGILIPSIAVMMLINVLFIHEGMTILFYLPNDNPVTLESIVYGAAAATMFVSVICWFSCYNRVVSSDKFIYLFGKIAPSLSLILSMALRFVPHYKVQAKAIVMAQAGIHGKSQEQGLIDKARRGLKAMSILTSWALENAIDTADSMKARGYGLKGRTSFHHFRFDNRDGVFLGLLLFLTAVMIWGTFNGAVSMRFYPTIQAALLGMKTAVTGGAYLLLCLLPILLETVEGIKWKYFRSKI